jgi:hypothetical protein
MAFKWIAGQQSGALIAKSSCLETSAWYASLPPLESEVEVTHGFGPRNPSTSPRRAPLDEEMSIFFRFCNDGGPVNTEALIRTPQGFKLIYINQ